MSWQAWVAVVAGWALVNVLFLAWQLDVMRKRVARLEARQDLAERMNSIERLY